MKFRTSISCFLLSALVLLLLSTVTQAIEYREVNKEVKAEDVLKHIENGDEINLTDCHIVGELNVSTIKLKTVPKTVFNLEFYKSLGEDLTNVGFTTSFFVQENNKVIENNITIKNSIFENCLNFSSVLFNSSTDFSGTTFNSDAKFSGTTFNSDAEFSGTDFNSDAEFSGTNFSGNAEFSGTHFSGNASFYWTNFSGNANFSGTNFSGNADFSMTNFSGNASFFLTNFSGNADFSGTNFSGNVDFSETDFSGNADFSGTDFNESAYFGVPHTAENIITHGGAYEYLMKCYNAEARYSDADNIYYNYRKYTQEEKSLTSFSKWTDIFSWITCGYGVRPFRILYSGVLIVGVFTLLYWRGKGIYRSSDIGEKKPKVSFWDALYFSTSTFTTLGSADWYPTDNFRKWVTLEGLLGWIMLGIFMATLTAVMIRV